MPKERKSSANSRSPHMPYLPWKAPTYPRHSSAATSTSPNQLKEWREALCPVCLEPPHKAVLLLCSSHDKGCRPFMCDTSYRHSNCLNQYRKNSGLRTTQNEDIKDQSSPSILSCPLCRGTVTGWIIDDAARNYMNTLSRSCSLESCGFRGAHRELRKHARKEHPSIRPSEPDSGRLEDWRRVEEEQGLGDAISMLQSEQGFDSLMDMLQSEEGFEEGFQQRVDMLLSIENIEERIRILQLVKSHLEDRIRWEAQVRSIINMLLLHTPERYTVFMIFDKDDDDHLENLEITEDDHLENLEISEDDRLENLEISEDDHLENIEISEDDHLENLEISEESSNQIQIYPELGLIHVSSIGITGRRNAMIILADSFIEELSTQDSFIEELLTEGAQAALANIERLYDDEAYENRDQSPNRDEAHGNLEPQSVCQETLVISVQRLRRNAAPDNLIELDESHDNGDRNYNGDENHSNLVRKYGGDEAGSSSEQYGGLDHYEGDEGHVNSERPEPHGSSERRYDGVEQDYGKNGVQDMVEDITDEDEGGL